MIYGQWKTAAAAATSAAATEVDLGKDFSHVLALIPSITNASVTIEVSNTSGGTFYPLYGLKVEATGSEARITDSGDDPIAVVYYIGGAQYIKMVLSIGTANILVRGC